METLTTTQQTLSFMTDHSSGKILKRREKEFRSALRRQLGEAIRLEFRIPKPSTRIAQVHLPVGEGDSESVRTARTRCAIRKVMEVGSRLEWRQVPIQEVPLPEKGFAYDPSCFSHIFDREAQLHIIEKTMKVAFESEFRNRYHCLLHGPPGGSKTETLRAISKMLGPGMVLELDATSTTKAGAERVFLEAETVPPILLIEELEMVEEDQLRWLLGVMDLRGEISKTNHAIGSVRKAVAPLCLAATNDLEKVEKFLAGALASRFSHRVLFPAPDRALLERILAREIETSGGDPRWIGPALDYCIDQERTTDPRRVVAVFRTGGDDLLTGEFQQVLRKTSTHAGWIEA